MSLVFFYYLLLIYLDNSTVLFSFTNFIQYYKDVKYSYYTLYPLAIYPIPAIKNLIFLIHQKYSKS